MNYKGPESLLLNSIQPCYSLPCINSSSQKSSVVVSEVCYQLPDTKSLFYVGNNCSVQLHYSCYGPLNLLWTHYYHLLPSLCTQLHSLTAVGVSCICVYPFKHLQTGLNVNVFSTRLNYWVAAGAVGDGCLNQWPLKRYPHSPLRCLLFTRLDAALFFPVGTIQQAFWISSFLFVWQNIFDSDVLSGWGRAAAFQTLNANVYFISDSTMMLFPCIFPLFFSSV